MNWLLLGLALALIAAALRLRRSTGVPWTRIASSDTGSWRPLREPLIARRFALAGKPDYLMGRGRRLIPVEVKPGRQADAPYPADVMQLAAYCLLVEETTGIRPPHGLLRYAQATFKIRFTDRLRAELLALLDEMRAGDPEVVSRRSHAQRARCEACGFVEQCDQALV